MAELIWAIMCGVLATVLLVYAIASSAKESTK